MKNWQFLIQRQGDHTWRTLESSNLKLFAGNYRVLARSNLSNTDVEVRLTHVSTQETPPKRRILKRLRRTNAEGLMAVIPFTHFKPGIWELRCSGDVMSDMLGQSWQHTLTIEVLPPETTPQPPNKVSEPSDLPSQIDTEVNIVMNHGTPIWLKGETTEQILENLLDLALSKDEPLIDIDEETIENAPTLPPPLPLNLSLEEDTYVARWGENLSIHGYVETNEIENLDHEKFSLEAMSYLGIEISLRSPLESKILKKIQHPLKKDSLPLPFSSLIDIPSECESKLLLADINLYGKLVDVGQVMLLASHTFTITADVTELLAIQTSSSDSHRFGQETKPPKPPKPVVNVGLELFNLAKTPKLAQFHVLKPSSNQPLPPQIKPQSTWGRISPQLPILPNHPPAKINSDPAKIAADRISATPPIDLKKLLIKPINKTFPYLKRLKATISQEEIVNHNLDHQNLPVLAQSPELPSLVSLSATTPELPIDDPQEIYDSPIAETTYAELIAEIVASVTQIEPLVVVNTEENVLNEVLETVGTEIDSPIVQKSTEIQGYVFSPDVTPTSPDQDIQENDPFGDGQIDMEQNFADEDIPLKVDELKIVNSPYPIEPLWISQEIVIDDLVMEVNTNDISDQPVENTPLSEDETPADVAGMMINSLPSPQLFLPDGELVAGTSVAVRLELPEVLSSVAVKLWVEDYQTRSLLDGPHILSDLRSNAWGAWETTISLKIPFGCLEIRLAAITINQSTQQESNRVAVIKTVIPPDLPTIELDDILGI
ncbi:hypothetical protein [Cuspidothrix issatschenkoi]|uniref:Uncharacterized protein n=1 Tax=Cuspidothrix issatschenkoi CHARLIE-1 TaxID=2052836 RepID=A0A2S6CZN4_9CYAN|nr:hypothetical protein [Cuspidothrix issatschenkoi]PPJ65167.1 hypothetical protein CUN59_00505 [Cuspidothrix issatschenkoi CHARLIE-1]